MQKGQHWGEKIITFLKTVVPADKALVDIGAHVGCISVPMAKHCKMVYSFEPQSIIHELLLTNFKNNDAVNFKAYHEALGHKVAATTMAKVMPDGSSHGKEVDYDSSAPSNFGGLPLGEGGEKIEMGTLDSFKITNIGAIKVDVEGAEPLVFYGAQETIKANMPVIVYESNYKRVTDEMRRSLNLPLEVEKFDIVKFTKDLGYQPPFEIDGGDFVLIPKHDMSSILKAKFITPGNGEANFYKLGGYCYVMMHEVNIRGPYTVHTFADNLISVNFDGHRIDGDVTKEGIQWSNGTTWKLK